MATNNQLIPTNQVMTRKSSTTSLLSTSSGQTLSNTSTSKDYTLDKAKSLEKKSSLSCLKEHMKYELKQGNNLVIELNMSAYELSKKCLHELLYSGDFAYAVEKRQLGSEWSKCGLLL